MEFIFRNGTIAKQKKKAEMYYNWANDNDTDRYQFMWKKKYFACMCREDRIVYRINTRVSGGFSLDLLLSYGFLLHEVKRSRK